MLPRTRSPSYIRRRVSASSLPSRASSATATTRPRRRAPVRRGSARRVVARGRSAPCGSGQRRAARTLHGVGPRPRAARQGQPSVRRVPDRRARDRLVDRRARVQQERPRRPRLHRVVSRVPDRLVESHISNRERARAQALFKPDREPDRRPRSRGPSCRTRPLARRGTL